MDLAALLAQNYIRWRHGIVGSADQPTFDATEKALTEATGVDVSTLDDAAIMALFEGKQAKAQDVLTPNAMSAVKRKWDEAVQMPPEPTPTRQSGKSKEDRADSTGSN
jgi:hypothetical protein